MQPRPSAAQQLCRAGRAPAIQPPVQSGVGGVVSVKFNGVSLSGTGPATVSAIIA